jgi:TorA specific chaperone
MTAIPHSNRFLEAGVAPAFDVQLSLREHSAECFRWLSDLFAAAPERGVIASYRRGEAAVWLDSLAPNAGLANGLLQMRRVLDQPWDDAELTRRIGVSYGQLFLGIGGPHTIAPYESALRFGGRLYQAPASEMAALLRAHNLSVSTACAEPADHLAIELALMAHLTAIAHPDRMALRERLEGWVPEFAELCARQDKLGFWAGAASVLSAVVLASQSTESIPPTSNNQVY